jgi:hypothetical protein
MAPRKYSAQEIVAKLHQVEVYLSDGHSLMEALGFIGVSNALYAKWLTEFGGLTRTLVPTLGSSAKK